MNAKEFQTKIIKEIIKPLFKEYGYGTKGNNFFKKQNNIVKAISIQNFSWNTKEDLEFCFVFGFYFFKNVNDEIPQNISAHKSDFNLIREPSFLPECRVKGKYRERFQYHIDLNTNYDEFLDLLIKDFKDYIFPKFEAINNINNCVEYFKDIKVFHDILTHILSKKELI